MAGDGHGGWVADRRAGVVDGGEVHRASDWLARRNAIGRVLADHQALWRSKPFCETRPAWVAGQPALAARLRALDDETTRRLARGDGDGSELLALLTDALPTLNGLAALIAFPGPGAADASTAGTPPAEADWRVLWEVPGRKSAQITAFAAALGPLASPMLEWCAGKGHLGRLLARRGAPQVTSLEIDGQLCAEGTRLALRLDLPQRFRQADALARGALDDVAGHHAVALHACGDLHRVLVRGAGEAALEALELAPCCYQRSVDEIYSPLAGPLPDTPFVLTRDDLRLAVTGAATASAAEVAAVETETAWKLAFQQLQQTVSGLAYRPVPPLSRSALRAGFRGYVETLAARAGIALGHGIDWAELETIGWQRQRAVARLTLLRYGFRRAIEAFVVCDLAAGLVRQGYAVTVRSFCDRSLTPRNLLISARRRAVA